MGRGLSTGLRGGAAKAFNASRLALAVMLIVFHQPARAELEPKCVEDSPERRGEIGCSYIEDKALPPLKEPLVWNIDRFDSDRAAQAAVGPAGVAFEADGAWWLMTIESSASSRHGGTHVATVPLPRLPPA